MTKEEAIKAVSEGKKVRHRYFSDNEWITEIDGMIHSEDGIICDTTTFWSNRTLPGWESDWEIINMYLTNTAVHCPTEELAKKVLEKAHSMGYKWKGGASFLSKTYWNDEGQDTCYLIEKGQYGSLDWCKKRCYKIISAEEFLKEPKTSSVEEIKKPTPEQ